MTESTRPPARVSEDLEVAWTEYVDTLLGWRRFLIAGALIIWGTILLAALLMPRQYACQAVLAFPGLDARRLAKVKEPDKERRPVGIPLYSYKKLERTLGDFAILQTAFKGEMTEGQLRRFARGVGQYISPLTTNTRDDILRIDREDRIVGAQIWYEDTPAARAQRIAEIFTNLIREALATSLALDAIDAELARATDAASKSVTEKMELSFYNQSLQSQAADLERLAARFPGMAGSPREVVDVGSGNHRYLPPNSQIVGIKATQADNDHHIRISDRDFAIESLRASYLQQLSRAVQAEYERTASHVIVDMPRLMRTELKAFLDKKGSGSPEAHFVEVDMNGIIDSIDTFRAGTRLVQYPTLARTPIVPVLFGVGVVATLLLLLAVLVADSWQRYHARA
jgi:hypothetical protein